MGRSGYSDELDDDLALGRYRGRVMSAIRGRRGQRCLREMLAALDAMPVKRLIAGELEKAGEVCALGALGRARGIDMTGLDPEDAETVAPAFDIAEPLAREIVFENDEVGSFYGTETPEQRFQRMREWAASQILGGTP